METQVTSSLRDTLAQRSAHLLAVSQVLKQELFGIDEVIDRVIDAVRAWYVMPELITRPVIVCLWGLTGTGKTRLARRLAQELGFYDRFVEVQMDGFSHGSGYRSAGSISAMLAESAIAEAAPGILLLDEFQRFRTMDTKGNDIKVERYQDVWALLSDGRLAPALSFLSEIESALAWSQYGEADDDGDEDKPDKPRKPRFKLAPYEAKELKRCLKLTEPLLEIMAWDAAQLHDRVLAFRREQRSWETDYSKLLVFVTGNLDEMYQETAQRVEDCDTDADIFHALTSKLSLIDVKKALAERFRPEQVARLGNNHVIYPSFDRATYERLIQTLCERYCDEIAATCGVRFRVAQAVLDELYSNGVFPAQGTRPLFSTVHAVLGSCLVNAALWALENGYEPGGQVLLDLDHARRHLVATLRGREQAFPAAFELSRLKQRSNADFRALLAVHEAGHGLAYGLLFGQPPEEIRINVASFEGGYNSFSRMKASSRRNCEDMVCVTLAGRAAEALVFGDAACTTGAEQDLKQATAIAARHARHLGFGARLSRTDVTRDPEENLNTEVEPTNEAIEALLQQQYARAKQLLQARMRLFLDLVDRLGDKGFLTREETAGLLGIPAPQPRSEILEPYADQLQAFRAALPPSPPAASTAGTSAILPCCASYQASRLA